MEFVHRPYIPGDTIAAIATPPGEGGIAVIRVTGENALSVVSKIYSGPIHTYKSHTAHLGKILDLQGNTIDEVLVLILLGKRSFAGEDTVEIHCHGGSIVTKKVLGVVLQAGARAALPGEFSFKAFMSGKIDLAQAEAVQELIGAKNEKALFIAEQQLQGALSNKIEKFQKELVDIAAILEAWVDFPEEGLEFATKEEILCSLQTTLTKMKTLSDTFHEGKVIKEGLSLCLAGPPNAGKSSLMNALLGKDRAIVTDIPGTTRDLLEEDILLAGLHFRITDTAGIRETTEVIEKEGIKRSRQAMQAADIVLLIFDASMPIGEKEEELLRLSPPEKTILVWNKIDLQEPTDTLTERFSTTLLSAKTGHGIDLLKQTIEKLLWRSGPPSKEEVVISSLRHKQALDAAIGACDSLMFGLEQEISPEFLSMEMRKILVELGTILGTNITEDVLSAIFSKFCVGK